MATFGDAILAKPNCENVYLMDTNLDASISEATGPTKPPNAPLTARMNLGSLESGSLGFLKSADAF